MKSCCYIKLSRKIHSGLNFVKVLSEELSSCEIKKQHDLAQALICFIVVYKNKLFLYISLHFISTRYQSFCKKYHLII